MSAGRHPSVPTKTGPAPHPDPRPLLLASRLDPETVAALLHPYGIVDWKRADANVQSMAGDPRSRALLAEILPDLLEAAAETADPDLALTHWERFVEAGANRASLFTYLRTARRMLHLLCTLFGNSPYLAQTLIRDPLLVYWLAEERVLTKRPSARELDRGLRTMLANVTAPELKYEALRRFKRREMLRIGVRDLLKLADVPETTEVLSHLAAVLIQAAYEIVQAELKVQYGTPMHRDRAGKWVETGFAVIAMGKLGGGELNFSSDVDLIYVYASDEGMTRVPGQSRAISIPNEEYFEYLARGLTRALTEHTQEGSVFRVDLRLRAEGSVGQLARSLARYRQYYRARGEGWERQALLKARPIAGDEAVGRAFLRMARPLIFLSKDAGQVSTSAVIDQVKALKAMIDEKMAGRGHERRNVKLGIGGIREIEFLVQAVQMCYGRRLPSIVHRNTLTSLVRFRQAGLLSAEEQTALTRAYLFLRDVEHKLQMVHDLQTHALPDSPDELARCASRLGYTGVDRKEALRLFLADHQRHTACVNQIFRSLVDSPERSALLGAALKK
ncbi:[protein-PII] uridylyltransferase family protein [Candidatus Nitrospira bockiana]